MPPEDHGSRDDGSIPMAVGDGADPGDGAASTSGSAAVRGPGVRRWQWLVGLVVVVVAAGAWLLRSSGDAGPVPVHAPTVRPDLRWSLDVAVGSDVEVVVLPDPDGDDVLVRRAHPDGGDGRQLLERFDGVTGRRAWSVPVRSDDVVVPLLGGRPVGGPDYRAPEPARVVAVSMVDGAEVWTQPGSAGTAAARLDDGSLVVTGSRGCGTVGPGTGRARFVLANDDGVCEPTGDLIRWRDGGDWVMVDGSGEEVARVPATRGDVGEARRPQLIGGLIVALGADANGGSSDRQDLPTVTAVATDGGPVWDARLDGGGWSRIEDLGDGHLMVRGPVETAVLDAATGLRTGRVGGAPIPVVAADGTVRLVGPADGLSRLQATGVWSRSPDATTIALVDLVGDRGGERELVVTSDPHVTADGLLLGHGPDDDRRVSLFAPDDLAVVWDLPTELRFAQVLASSAGLVVLAGEVDGARRLDVYAP